MRKWMRDRLKRRKKTQEDKPAETTQAPLQPAYFDAEQSPEAEPEQEEQPEAAAPAEESAEPQPVESAQSASNPAGSADARPKRRRRRGRGGRGGRGGRSSATRPAQAAPLQPTLMPESSEASQPEPSQPAAAVPRAPKGVVVLAIGLPGSGKSSWFKRHGITPLSSDLLRQLLFDDANEQRFQDLVFSNLRSMLKARLIARRPTNYVDATNLSQHDRHTWIKMARDYGYEVHAVYFDVPLEVCLERNRKRQRVVGDDVMQRMASKLRAPSFEEGFAKITVVRVKKKDEPA